MLTLHRILVAFPRSALLYILGKRQDFVFDSDSDSDSDSEADSDSDTDSESKSGGDRRIKARGEEDAAHSSSHAVVQVDDIFCGSRRR